MEFMDADASWAARSRSLVSQNLSRYLGVLQQSLLAVVLFMLQLKPARRIKNIRIRELRSQRKYILIDVARYDDQQRKSIVWVPYRYKVNEVYAIKFTPVHSNFN
jgi:hypothetical protein